MSRDVSPTDPPNRACSIFFFEGWVGVAPTIINLTRMLDADGSRVTIYATMNPYPAPPSLGAGARVLYLRRPENFPGGRFAFRVLRRLRLGSALPGIELLTYACQCWIASALTRAGRTVRKGPSVGVDTMGSIVAMFRRLTTGRRYAYLSFEFRDVDRTRLLSWFVNPLERAAYRRADLVVIQDRDRLRTLERYLGFKHPNVIFLPNSPRASASQGLAQTEDNFLRRRLSISAAEFPVIVLSAGMIDPEVFSEEAAAAFNSVGHGAALVYHERRKRTDGDAFIARLRDVNRRNLFLSLDPVSLDEVDLVYASATIGLAFYRESDASHTNVAMASGKIGQYLMHGKPLLVNRTESLGRFIDQTRVGVAIDDPTDGREIDAALAELLANYTTYSANARKYFEDEMDFDRKARPLLDALGKL